MRFQPALGLPAQALPALVSALALVFASACETVPSDPSRTGFALASPSLSPEEGVFYRYGTFCGPGVPDLTGVSGAPARLAAITALAPVDDIDRACKAHDVCYEKFGHDRLACDGVIVALTTSWNLRPFEGNEYESGACVNQAHEIANAFVYGKEGGANAEEIAARAQLKESLGGMVVASGALLLLNARYGFPTAPGQCALRPQIRAEREANALGELRKALLDSRCAAADSACRTANQPDAQALTVADLYE